MTTIKEIILDAIIESLELGKRNLEVGSDQWREEAEAIVDKAEAAIRSGRAV